MALPPLDGAANVTVACMLPAIAAAPVGASGTVFGMTAFDKPEKPLAPAALTATTVNWYDVPFVSPVTTCVVPVVPALLSVPPPGIEKTV